MSAHAAPEPGAPRLAAPQPGGSPAGAVPLLQVRNLSVTFPTEDGLVRAVRDVSYSVTGREVLGIVGESGSGKSVSSMAVMGLLGRNARVTGSILLDGADVLAMSPSQQRALRGRRIGMIFQDPMTALNPVHTVGDQLAEAVRSHATVARRIALKRAEEMLGLVGIPQPRERLRNYPHEFSGGMRQRVMIAMAVINNPDVIIADEPTTALDVTVQAQILETLLEVRDAVNAAIILITHDLGVVAGMSDRVLVMYAGRAVECGTAHQIFNTPRMPYTAGLLGSVPSLETAGSRLRPIPGSPPSLINLPPGCPFSPRCPMRRPHCDEVEPDLISTENHGQAAACHYWDELADREDPRAIFSQGGGAE